MSRRWSRVRLVLVLGALAWGCAGKEETPPAAGSDEPAPKPVVALETNKGLIRMELEPDLAPETVENFLLHVRSGFYDDMLFYRVRAGFMIQAGQLTSSMAKRTSPTWPIANEADNGLLNVRGAVAMARTGDPHSAKSEFFINLVDNPALDFKEKTATGWGYAVFGHVIEGMDVVDAIGAVSVSRRGQYEAVPDEPIVIRHAYVEENTTP